MCMSVSKLPLLYGHWSNSSRSSCSKETSVSGVECVGEKVRVGELEGDMVERVREADRVWVQHDDGGESVCV